MLQLTPQDQKRVELWFDLLSRYQNLGEKKMMPLLAVRMLCVRYGFTKVIERMRSHGEDTVTKVAMDGLHDMAKLWFHMVQRHPPSPEHHDGVMQGIHAIQVASRSSEVSQQVFKMLSRILIREAALKARGTVQ